MQGSEGASRHRSHHQCASQARRHRGRNGIDGIPAQTALRQSLVNETGKSLHMTTRRDFGNHSPPAGVLLDLRRDRGREDSHLAVRKTHHGCCRLVTTCFEGKHCWHRGPTPPLLSA